jgi:uncharacterized RDD family membrane protein YckC
LDFTSADCLIYSKCCTFQPRNGTKGVSKWVSEYPTAITGHCVGRRETLRLCSQSVGCHGIRENYKIYIFSAINKFNPMNEILDYNQPESKTAINVEVAMASGGKRFLNYIIDTIIVYLLMFITIFLLTIVMATVSPESVEGLDTEGSGFTALVYLVVFGAMIAYYTLMESMFGRTIGKMATGTRVVNKQGSKPTTKAIFLRSLSRLVPFDAFSFLGSSARGWHDQWTDTWVISQK